MLGINSLKMFAAVLLMTGTTVAFNIYNVPVHHFTSDDPLFGQSLVQSSDGVYVLSPTNGEVKCKLGNNCSKLNIPVSGKKGLRPVASAASKWNKEKILVCNQVRTKVGSTENLNGNCTLLSGEKKEDINPASLDEININKTTFEGTCHEPLKQDSTNINNNNNNYHGNPTGYQVHQRMRREVEKNDKETDEDEDAGTEIAFVLDGSGSIEAEDFEKAKYFIYNVMKNVWTSCFSCNFAIVQYGSKIRTELSLLENDNRTEALNKVKNIKQTYNLTKTASALYHVLTEVFVPESGSKKDAKKMIILLSDGRILGDNRSLPDVLNMTEMKDILRFSIGIGPDVVNNPIAVKEMIQIAGDENRYFSLSSYAALENILSPLEQRIIGIKDAGTEIAFVLDGSGSIEEEDFEKAKNFIYNVMKNVWTSCFSCNFAIVQYGSEIRTELSLLENDNRTEALNKVKSIKQTYNLTKTASALHHVLTEVFVPESGSKKDTKKMIILLSDGRILGDNRSLPDVLNMTEMKDILRFAIGIGPDVVNNPIAVKEMIQIAGDENRYFSLSSYAALENILSPLEQRIIGIKG